MQSYSFIRKGFGRSRSLDIIKNYVTTWSPLGTAFNVMPAKKMNLGFTADAGLFKIEKLTHAEGFYVLKNRAVEKADLLIAEACSPSRERKIVDIFDELSDNLCQVADLGEFVRSAHPDGKFQSYAENVSSHISGVVEQLNTNKGLYDALKNVVINGDKFPTTEVDQHVAELFVFDFEQCGIHLPDKERKKVVSLNECLLNLGQFFIRRTTEPAYITKGAIPEHLAHFFPLDGDHFSINGLYSDSPNEEAREAAYKMYLPVEPQQEYLLEELLKYRHELAVTCGFPTYAHRVLRNTTAETPEFVAEFLEKLSENVMPKAEKDLQKLFKLKQMENPSAKRVEHWDIGYLSCLMRKRHLQLGADELSSYFSLGACMEGLNNLTQKLFGISLVCEVLKPKEAWSFDVYKLAVVHETEGLLGHIYCDFYHRPGKPNQDCHFTVRGGRELPDGSYQNPIVVLMLNLQVPLWSSPCLLTPWQLDNLCHEMGHALHSMLGRTKHQHVTGTRCCTDFAEVPSILMEYFVSDPRVLRTFTKHFQTKEPMRDEIVQRVCDSKRLLNATETQTQILYSALDQAYHGAYPLGGSTTDIYMKLQEKYSLLRPVPNTAWQLRFSHLVGYGAKYYSYLLSRSIASSIWQTYFKDDPFSREQGERYRRECLNHGGGKPPRQLLSEFLNKETTPASMAEWLINDI